MVDKLGDILIPISKNLFNFNKRLQPKDWLGTHLVLDRFAELAQQSIREASRW